jgi:hypothetical protein
VQDGKFFYRNRIEPISEEIFAIEVKVKDWLRGARKAYRYSIFADQVFIALDSNYYSRINRQLLFDKNIGIISIDTKSKGFYFEASLLKSNPDPVKKAFTSEQLFREYLKVSKGIHL